MQAQPNSLSSHINLLLSKTQQMLSSWHLFLQERTWKGELQLFYMEMVCQQLAPLLLSLSVEVSCQAARIYVVGGPMAIHSRVCLYKPGIPLYALGTW